MSRHECGTCKQTFDFRSQLTSHIRTHTGEKPYKCDICPKTFSSNWNLNMHRRLHTNHRPFECDTCPKSFVNNERLHRHMQIHTDERPYKCTICSKAFIQSAHLVQHERIHSGEKPYVCIYCTEKFASSTQLKVHTRKHTGEIPYKCNICGKGFNYNHVLKKHYRTHFDTDVYMCNICNEISISKKTIEVHISSSHSDVTDVKQNTGTTERNGTDMLKLISFLGSDKKNKLGSSCVTVQQVKIQPRPSSSSTNVYEIDEMRESSLSPPSSQLQFKSYEEESSLLEPLPSFQYTRPAGISQVLLTIAEQELSAIDPGTVLDAPGIILDSKPYSYNACIASPPSSQLQFKLHEQQSSLLEPLPSFQYTRPAGISQALLFIAEEELSKIDPTSH